MIRIIVCDDHKLVRDGIVSFINQFSNCTVIGQACQGSELVSILNAGLCPDLILLDISMPPGISGYEVVKIIKKSHPTVKILILSGYFDINAIAAMKYMGASGFISKDIDVNQLKIAISEVAMGKSFYYNGRVNSEQNYTKVKANFGIKSLTAREIQVARLMCSEMTYKEIAGKLSISTNTLENIRIRLFNKTGSKSRSSIILFMVNTGLYKIPNVPIDIM